MCVRSICMCIVVHATSDKSASVIAHFSSFFVCVLHSITNVWCFNKASNTLSHCSKKKRIDWIIPVVVKLEECWGIFFYTNSWNRFSAYICIRFSEGLVCLLLTLVHFVVLNSSCARRDQLSFPLLFCM